MLSSIAVRILKRMASASDVRVRGVFPNGVEYKNYSDGTPDVTMVFKNTKSLLKPLFLGVDGVGFAYVDGDIDIEGEIQLLAKLVGDSEEKNSPSFLITLLALPGFLYSKYLNLKHGSRSIATAKENAKFHYDRGTALFQQYLDPTLMYTCAYWKEGTTSLEQAQRQKVDHVLRKLRLEPGMSLVDVGSGWGYLLVRALEKYGVTGVNVSPVPDQNAYFRKELEQKGYQDKIRIKEADFREDKEQYDRYVSIGVYEHAGRQACETWIKCMADSLKPGGIGMLHWIGGEGKKDSVALFMKKFVFPGAYLPSLGETANMMSKYGLEILDVENLRRHYHFTLQAWARNFDAHWDKIHAIDPKRFDERFRRAWRIYLHLNSEAFLKSTLRLYQVTFSKGLTTTYPMSRDFLYEKDAK